MTATDTKTRFLPWVIVGVAAVYLLSAVGRMNPPSKPFDLDAFARLPVVDGGRVKPLDTVARVSLRMISQKETVEDGEGREQPAIKWYLEVVSAGVNDQEGPAWEYRVFRVDNEQLLNQLGLKVREGLRYSPKEIAPALEDPDKFPKWLEAAQRRKERKQPLDLFDAKVLELDERVQLLASLRLGVSPLVLPPDGTGREETHVCMS